MGEKLVFCLRGELVSSWLGTLFVLRLQLPKKEEKVSSERTKKNLSSGRERERERGKASTANRSGCSWLHQLIYFAFPASIAPVIVCIRVCLHLYPLCLFSLWLTSLYSFLWSLSLSLLPCIKYSFLSVGFFAASSLLVSLSFSLSSTFLDSKKKPMGLTDCVSRKMGKQLSVELNERTSENSPGSTV